ncbi:ImmA/IrrE family metallo-endopeptidase [Trueperella pyogenes]|uniref:ImmA/IrrE family metallo-endopeptidase n=1 Tax=Trueperella pyogenes TaxID=1661 RepID=UPI00345D373F
MKEFDLIRACARLGVHVAFLPLEDAGLYIHSRRLIVVDSRLPEALQRATLAHEYVHALRGHDGPQSASVERCVDRQAARLLISPAEYALAERLHEGNPVGIAEDLGVPVWVVEAYRQALYDEFVSAH